MIPILSPKEIKKIEKNNFRVEGHSETEIFIRELGQNAIDAKRIRNS